MNQKETIGMLEEILSAANMRAALGRVKSNRGSHGIDGMTVDELPKYLVSAWPFIRQELLEGTYVPKPVRRVEIPKPDGGIRMLGIPTVLDRMIQQAVAQILSPVFEEQFSENSFGFRPMRSAHEAVKSARGHINEGHRWVVDIDLEKFFDKVNHDKLMARVARRITDKRVLSLIRKYLESGIMINGINVMSDEGTPQGGPMSPLLANIMLDDLDKELEKRGHKFCRYADDCNIYVRSKRAGERVMQSICRFIQEELSLKVNKSKSAVDRPWKRKFLGFSFYFIRGKAEIRIHAKSVKRFMDKIRTITNKNRSIEFEERLVNLARISNGWINYFSLADAKIISENLDMWIRRRLRACLWKQWKRIGTKYNNLVRLGAKKSQAWEWANTRKAYWRISSSWILTTTVTNEYLKKLGFQSILERYKLIHNSN